MKQYMVKKLVDQSMAEVACMVKKNLAIIQKNIAIKSNIFNVFTRRFSCNKCWQLENVLQNPRLGIICQFYFLERNWKCNLCLQFFLVRRLVVACLSFLQLVPNSMEGLCAIKTKRIVYLNVSFLYKNFNSVNSLECKKKNEHNKKYLGYIESYFTFLINSNQ